MTTDEILRHWRKIAENATADKWVAMGDTAEVVRHADGHNGARIADCYNEAFDHDGVHNAIFIATFDPPTILQILTVLDQLHRSGVIRAELRKDVDED